MTTLKQRGHNLDESILFLKKTNILKKFHTSMKQLYFKIKVDIWSFL